jgi:hypothetical protein
MKKWVLLLVLVATFALQAQVDVYGSIRYGFFYENQNKQWTGNVKRFEANQKLFATTHLGANFKRDNVTGKLELGLAEGSAVSLRHAYGEVNLGNMYMLIGQTFTGFDWAGVSSQMASVTQTYESALIGYGAFYDSRHPMIRLRMDNGFYVSFMKPVKMNPANLAINTIDATIPRINTGMKFQMDNFSIHPAFGFAMSNYHDELAIIGQNKIDESVMAWILAMSWNYKNAPFFAKGQIGYGQNIGDYGILTSTAAKAFWNSTDNEVSNVMTFGGFGELGYQINQKAVVSAGLGYVSSNHADFTEADQSMSAFINLIHKIQPNFSVIYETGFADKMKNKNDITEGSNYYIGWKFQLDLK